MQSEFVWSIKNGEIEQVKTFVEQKKVSVNDEIQGRKPLHYAADYGQKDIIKYLVEKGADVNASDKHGISALLAAIWEGHKECVELMLQLGAAKSGKSPDGKSYIECAENNDIKQLLK